jgi:hypothetical protein
MPTLTRVVPTECGQLVVEFASGDVRIFDCSAAQLEHDRPGFDWSALTSPEKLKHLTFSADGVRWPGGKVLEADYLFARSRPLSGPESERRQLRVAFRNQAPTRDHPSHHVYFVYVVPYGARPFLIGESINGGHAEMGGSRSFTTADLLAWPGWREHFELSGCGWAVALVEADGIGERARIDAVVREVCRRADTDDSDVVTYEAKRTKPR